MLTRRVDIAFATEASSSRRSSSFSPDRRGRSLMRRSSGERFRVSSAVVVPTEVLPGQALPHTIVGLAASCHVGDVESTAREIVARAKTQAGGYVCLCNVHLLTLALHDMDVNRALAGAWKRLPDGAPVAWLKRRVGTRKSRRIGGPDLMPRVVELGCAYELRHFLLGSTPEVLVGVQRALSGRYPDAQIVGSHSPPFTASDTADLEAIGAILAARPDVVWCALGAPKQELWMHRFSPELPGVVFLGVGAAFDFLAKTKPRAPLWMRRRGLEWLHRLVTEPRRLGGRYVRTNTEFVFRCALELSGRWRNA